MANDHIIDNENADIAMPSRIKCIADSVYCKYEVWNTTDKRKVNNKYTQNL